MAPLALILFQCNYKVSRQSLFSINVAMILAPASLILFFDRFNSFRFLVRPDRRKGISSSISSMPPKVD